MKTKPLFDDLKNLLSKYDLVSSFVVGSSANKREFKENIVKRKAVLFLDELLSLCKELK